MKPNPADAKVLIASDNVDDLAQILQQLRIEHPQVRGSIDPDLAIADFEDFGPDVLVLGFDSIEKAQRYSLGLYRQSQFVNQHRHGTVLLCTKDELRAAFDLCKKGFFDDYVLYWPLSHDGQRLAMSVWNTARETLAVPAGPSAEELRTHAAQLGAVENLLQEQLSEGSHHAGTATQSLKQTEIAVGAAIDEFSQRLTRPGLPNVVDVKDAAGLAREFDRLKSDRVSAAFKANGEALAPIAAWPQKLEEKLEPLRSGMRTFAAKIQEGRPIVMVVEDDEFARKLIAKALQQQPYEVVFANDGTAALAELRRIRPRLILMDVNLPDMDGVALTRKIKAVPHLADIPVLMLTGDARRETLASSVSAGAAGFIVKPFSREALIGNVARFLPAGS